MTGKWFECKVTLSRTLENGMQKTIRETYIVDALNFTEAESRILEELRVYGEVNLVSIKYCDAQEIVDSKNTADEKWYKVKIAMISIDESAGKEKKVNIIYYVRARDFKTALANTEAYMQGSVMDYDIVSIVETNVIEVFEYRASK